MTVETHFVNISNRHGRYLVTCSCGKAIKDSTGRVSFNDYPDAYAAARAHERGEDDD